MAAASRRVIEPTHKPAGGLVLSDLYGDFDFYDDISGASLDHKLASAARKTEIDFFKSRGVYTKVTREA